MTYGVVGRVERLVRACIQKVGLAHRNALLVVASSGGPDSQALLYSLATLRGELGLALHLAHLNHDFRGEEAEEDARFVAAQGQALGLPLSLEKVDPVAYQRQHRISSFEAAAREVRYDFLAQVAGEVGAAAVALGHTADDQAETVLMHILRGTGLHGLRGMESLSIWHHPRRTLQVTLVRPLLEVSRGETEAYCAARGIPFRVDTSNKSLRFTRNRLRWRLLPSLRSYNPRFQESLLRLARLASLHLSYLDGAVSEMWPLVAQRSASSTLLDATRLKELHPLLQSLLLRRAYEELASGPSALEEKHIQAMARMLKAAPGKALHLPRGVRILSGYGQLLLDRGGHPPCPLPQLEGEHPLKVPGETPLPGWLVRAEVLGCPPEELPDGRWEACFDMGQVEVPLWVRTRRRGDRFQPLGMEAPKKLQDLFVDQKVPRHWRDRVPLAVSEAGILWVVGYRTAHWARVRKETKKVLCLAFQSTPGEGQ